MIAADPGRPLSLDAVAREIMASRRSLQRAFEASGITFRQAVAVARVHRAKTLFAEGSPPVYRVARAVGYSSNAEFTKAFKRYANTLPSEYRRAMVMRSSPQAQRRDALVAA